MNFFKKLDGFSIVHFLWPYAFVLTAVTFGLGSSKATWIAIVLAAIWEGLDEVNEKYSLKWWWLDPAGFSLSDFLYGCAGAALAWIVTVFF